LANCLFSILIIAGSACFGFTLDTLTVAVRSVIVGFLFLTILTGLIETGRESARPPTFTFVFGFIKVASGLFQLSPKNTIIHLRRLYFLII